MANKLTDAEKLAKLNDEKDKAEQLLHKAQENLKRKEAAAARELDRQRTNRLCTHGGHLEMYLEEPELFTKEEICKLVDYFFTSNAVKNWFRICSKSVILNRNLKPNANPLRIIVLKSR